MSHSSRWLVRSPKTTRAIAHRSIIAHKRPQCVDSVNALLCTRPSVRLLYLQRAWERLNSSWRNLYQKNQDDFQKKIGALIVENSFLHRLALDDRNAQMKACGKFTELGAIEHIVYQARLEGRIPSQYKRTQAGLDKIATQDEFTVVLKEQLEGSGVALSDAVNAVHNLCRVRPDWTISAARGPIVTAYPGKYTKGEYIALTALLKMQSKWVGALDWR